jgi:azurin
VYFLVAWSVLLFLVLKGFIIARDNQTLHVAILRPPFSSGDPSMSKSLSLVFLAFMIGCGQEAPAPAPAPAPEAAPEVKPEPVEEKVEAPSIVTDDGAVATIALEGNDMMQFNAKEIRVAAGRKVKLTLTHTGKAPLNVMGHNFVLLAKDTVVQDFTTKASRAAATNYIPEDMKGNVLASTETIGGGSSTTIEFDAPEVGEYDFLCSFPGHFAIMKGKFIVE